MLVPIKALVPALIALKDSNLFSLLGVYDSSLCIVLQGFMIVDRTSLYGSRNMLDQHRDMRMDIDNMGYEVIIIVSFQLL